MESAMNREPYFTAFAGLPIYVDGNLESGTVAKHFDEYGRVLKIACDSLLL
jgi:hypothetical protein